MEQPLTRLLNAMCKSLEGGLSRNWQPAVDVYRTDEGYVARFELAGVRREDVTVEVSHTRLTVRGSRRDRLIEDRVTHVRMEISYSSFERSVELPDRLDTSRIETDMQDGMLVVRVFPEDKPAATEAP